MDRILASRIRALCKSGYEVRSLRIGSARFCASSARLQHTHTGAYDAEGLFVGA
jgi:hypothetical protein